MLYELSIIKKQYLRILLSGWFLNDGMSVYGLYEDKG